MVKKAAEKIVEGLTQLMEGFSELQESVDREFGEEEKAEADDDDEEEEEDSEADAALVTEVRNSLELFMDAEDFGTDEIAAAVSALTEALEEIDPNIFASAAEEGLEEEGFYEDEELEDEDLEDLDEEEFFDEDDDDDDDELEDDEDDEED